MCAAAWAIALLAAFVRWGGPVCLPWRGHRGGDPRVAAAHVAAAAIVAALLGAWLPDPAAGALACGVTIAGSWSAKALRSAAQARPACRGHVTCSGTGHAQIHPASCPH